MGIVESTVLNKKDTVDSTAPNKRESEMKHIGSHTISTTEEKTVESATEEEAIKPITEKKTPGRTARPGHRSRKLFEDLFGSDDNSIFEGVLMTSIEKDGTGESDSEKKKNEMGDSKSHPNRRLSSEGELQHNNSTPTTTTLSETTMEKEFKDLNFRVAAEFKLYSEKFDPTNPECLNKLEDMSFACWDDFSEEEEREFNKCLADTLPEVIVNCNLKIAGLNKIIQESVDTLKEAKEEFTKQLKAAEEAKEEAERQKQVAINALADLVDLDNEDSIYNAIYKEQPCGKDDDGAQETEAGGAWYVSVTDFKKIKAIGNAVEKLNYDLVDLRKSSSVEEALHYTEECAKDDSDAEEDDETDSGYSRSVIDDEKFDGIKGAFISMGYSVVRKKKFNKLKAGLKDSEAKVTALTEKVAELTKALAGSKSAGVRAGRGRGAGAGGKPAPPHKADVGKDAGKGADKDAGKGAGDVVHAGLEKELAPWIEAGKVYKDGGKLKMTEKDYKFTTRVRNTVFAILVPGRSVELCGADFDSQMRACETEEAISKYFEVVKK